MLLRRVLLLQLCLRAASHSWIDNISDTANLTNVGYIRDYGGHIDAQSSYLIQSTDPATLICKENERSRTSYSAAYPMLRVAAGASLVANYSENGHVTKDKLPDGPRPGTYRWYLSSSLLSTYGDLSNVSTTTDGNFDDGKCAEDATRGRAGPRQCQSFIRLPTDLAEGIYTLVWLWTFPKVVGVVEMYSSCLDIEIVSSSSSSSSSVAAISNDSDDGTGIATGVKVVDTQQPSSTTFITQTVSMTVWVSPLSSVLPTATSTTGNGQGGGEDGTEVTTVGATDSALRPGIYTLQDEVVVVTVTSTRRSLPTEALRIVDGSLAYT